MTWKSMAREMSLFACLCVMGSVCTAQPPDFPVPRIAWNPRSYVCPRVSTPLSIDGQLHESSWQEAPWSEDFVDIEGDLRPQPRFRTRVKMLWDDEFFYVGAELQEPHVWATLTERDAVIYHDNDFEVFIDPDGDTHEYYELEINALGTEWDLFLVKPYRDGGPALHAWDIQGLQTAVSVDGTLNQPGDVDRGWSVEIAFPWSVLKECAHVPTPPEPGDQWRVNFSRVEWWTDVHEGSYVKRNHPATGKPLAEDNWVWSPQGLIAMHYPEMWGFVQFSSLPSGKGREEFVLRSDDQARWALMQVYYKQKAWFETHGQFTAEWSDLAIPAPALQGYSWPPALARTASQFEAVLRHESGRALHVSQDGHLW